MDNPSAPSILLPPCIGDYEQRHTTCDGDPAGDSYKDRRPCARRDECVGFRVYCTKTGHDTSKLRRSLTPARLMVLCSRMIETYAIVDGVPQAADGRQLLAQATEVTPASLAPAAPAPPPPTRGRKTRWKKRNHRPLSPEMLALHDHFVDVLRQRFPERKLVFGNRVVAKQGVFYYVDHRDGHYVSWYCKAAHGHDRPIAMLVFRPRTGTITVRLPVAVEEIEQHVAKATIKRLDLTPYKKVGSRFLTEALHQKAVGLGTIAEMLRVLYDRGVLHLADQR